jgi:hypothetical protein
MSNAQLQNLTDINGNAIYVGARVIIQRLPGWLIHDLPSEDVARMQSIVCVPVSVSEIDTHGYVWIANANGESWFCVKPSELSVVQSGS